MTKASLTRFLGISIALMATLVGADEPVPKNYVLFPITSEFEKYLLDSCDAFVEVNADALLDGESLLPDRLNADGFRAEISSLRDSLGPEPSIKLYFRYSGKFPSQSTQQLLKTEVADICRNAGFSKVSTVWRFEFGKWTDKLDRLATVHADSNSKASCVDHELVRVFSARTTLARYLLGDVDCYVQLRQPIDGRFRDFPKSIRDQIVQSASRLEFSSKDVVMFRILATTAGGAAVQEYFRSDGKSPFDALAKEMGFQRCLYSMTTMGVGPEELLGKPAPDFTLESLTDGELNLHKAIQGRVAVIAFWGVACGGCRVEAPHLTRLHNMYSEKGLAVVAVNGYDEGKDVVAKYVEKEGLTHPIVLMGRNVAKDKYTVVSYPVTFLVDHHGVMQDYHLGFEQGDEKHLFDKVAQMLREREQP